jgi:asparagine N-glycosylation enzyme membrane subunit Stt3
LNISYQNDCYALIEYPNSYSPLLSSLLQATLTTPTNSKCDDEKNTVLHTHTTPSLPLLPCPIARFPSVDVVIEAASALLLLLLVADALVDIASTGLVVIVAVAVVLLLLLLLVLLLPYMLLIAKRQVTRHYRK